MSGTLYINDKETWIPAGWLFRGVLELIKNELSKTGPKFANDLFDSVQRDYCDFSELDGQQFKLVLEATDEAYNNFMREGHKTFADPTFLPGFIKHFESLKLSMHNDPRAIYKVLKSGTKN